MLALGVCFPTFTLLQTNRFWSTTNNSMKCLINWMSLSIRVRLRNNLSCLKGVPDNQTILRGNCTTNWDVMPHQRACWRDFHDIFSVFEFYEIFGFHRDQLIVGTPRGFLLWWFPNEEPKRRRPPEKIIPIFGKKWVRLLERVLFFQALPWNPQEGHTSQGRDFPFGGGGFSNQSTEDLPNMYPGSHIFRKIYTCGW